GIAAAIAAAHAGGRHWHVGRAVQPRRAERAVVRDAARHADRLIVRWREAVEAAGGGEVARVALRRVAALVGHGVAVILDDQTTREATGVRLTHSQRREWIRDR